MQNHTSYGRYIHYDYDTSFRARNQGEVKTSLSDNRPCGKYTFRTPLIKTMPRRLSLSASEQTSLFALPKSAEDLIRYYNFNESDLALIRQRRGCANRLGFAVQLCLLRYPGFALANNTAVTHARAH